MPALFPALVGGRPEVDSGLFYTVLSDDQWFFRQVIKQAFCLLEKQWQVLLQPLRMDALA